MAFPLQDGYSSWIARYPSLKRDSPTSDNELYIPSKVLGFSRWRNYLHVRLGDFRSSLMGIRVVNSARFPLSPNNSSLSILSTYLCSNYVNVKYTKKKKKPKTFHRTVNILEIKIDVPENQFDSTEEWNDRFKRSEMLIARRKLIRFERIESWNQFKVRFTIDTIVNFVPKSALCFVIAHYSRFDPFKVPTIETIKKNILNDVSCSRQVDADCWSQTPWLMPADGNFSPVLNLDGI